MRIEPGARWLRCDLHVHTPFDDSKKFGEDVRGAIEAMKKEKPQRLAAIAERFVDACRAAAGGAGVDLVALTDHNSIEGYRRLKPFFDAITQQARDQAKTMPAILPGVEFSVGGERPIHFLAIFAANTQPDDIERAVQFIFGPRELFDPKTGTPRATGESINQFLDQLYKYCRPATGERIIQFVLLPAHADGDRGVGRETGAGNLGVASTLWDEMKGHLRQWAVSRTDWNGFETLRPFPELPQAFRDLLLRWAAARRGEDWDTLGETQKQRHREQKHWALVECSDPHKYEAIGARYTWLKMEVPDVEGIRLALLDPESRLRRLSDGPPAHAYPRISRIEIRRTDFFDELEIPMNPCLTTLIGGRGSGKSTVIEYVRYALDRNRSEDFSADDRDTTREAVGALLAQKAARDFGESGGTLLPNHEIEVDLTVAGRGYRVRRTAGGAEVVPDPESPGAAPAPLDVRTLILPRILSQRQIARIARDPAAQRRELDALVGAEHIREFEKRRRESLDELTRLQMTRTRLRDKAKAMPSRETELQKVSDQIAFLEEGGRKETFDRFQAYQREEHWLSDVRRQVEAASTAVTEQADATAAVGQRLAAPPAGPTGTWMASVADRVRAALDQAAAVLRDQASALRNLVQTVGNEQAREWRPGFEEARREYDELRGEMQGKGVEFAQHEKLLQQRVLLERELRELRGLDVEIEQVEREVRGRRAALVQLHEERLAWRRAQAHALEEADADVLLDIIPFRDEADIVSRRDEWFGGAGVQERDWAVLMEHLLAPDGSAPDRLAELTAALRQDVEATRQIGRALDAKSSAVAKLLGSTRASQLTGHFYGALRRADRIRLDEMERFLPEDAVEAKVRGADRHFKPVTQGSLGERSTAMLSLLLSAGDQPLVIDQPEDDLDNRYVYEVVVDLLRKRKFSRQIIIATHNANIPVNGDAELIVALGVEDRLGKVLQMGSIDRLEVKDEVSRIMEGSAEAFRLRRERYGY